MNSSVPLLSGRPFTNLKERKEKQRTEHTSITVSPQSSPFHILLSVRDCVTVGYCSVSLRRLSRQLFTDIDFCRHNNECAGGASRLSRGPRCPSRLGFCFPQQKSHTPGQTRCQTILQQHRRHQVHTLRIEKQGVPGIQAIEGGGKDRKLKNQRPNPAAPTQGALSTALYHVKNGICHLPHRSLRS